MYQNHRNSNKNKTDQLSEHDIQYLNVWIAGWRGDPVDYDYYVKKAHATYIPKKKKFRFLTTNVLGGICLDCKQPRCDVCNGCPINFDDDIETARCQRCLCLPFQETKEPLNETDVPLDVLIARRNRGKRYKEGGSE
jgi:hypothetical protein